MALATSGSEAESSSGRLALGALILGIAAFIFGFVPVLGTLLGIVGVVLGVIALLKRQRRGFAITGIVLSSIGAVSSVFMIFVLSIAIPVFLNEQEEKREAEQQVDQEVEPIELFSMTVDTPCYAVNAPGNFVNVAGDEDYSDCFVARELRGELAADGTFTNTGAGASYGSYSVQPVPVAITDDLKYTDSLSATLESLNEGYFPKFGEQRGKPEKVSLDGAKAVVVRFDTAATPHQESAAIVAYSPKTVDTINGPVKLVLISISTVEGNLDEIIDQTIANWYWHG